MQYGIAIITKNTINHLGYFLRQLFDFKIKNKNVKNVIKERKKKFKYIY